MKRARHPVRNLVTRLHGLLFRRTNGRFGRSLRGMPVLVLETRGRKSGKPCSVPLLFVEAAGDWAVRDSSGGDPLHQARFLNVDVTLVGFAEPAVDFGSNVQPGQIV